MTIRPAIATPDAPTTIENADITVVGGAGHVGIPLVLALAEAGLRVNVNDLNQESLNTLAAGRLPFIERGAESVLAKALAAKRLVFSSAPDLISTGGPVIITIGTPVDEFLNPVRKVVQDCIDAHSALARRRATGGAALDRVSRHHRLGRLLPQEQGPQAEGGVLPGTRGAGQRPAGIARDAADRFRHARRRPNARPPLCSSASRRKWWRSRRSRRSSPSCSATPIATSSSPPPTSSTWSPNRPASITSACWRR